MTELDLLAIVLAVLLLLLLLYSSLPTPWLRWLFSTRQDAVNEQTVSTLESIAKALDTMTQRLDLLSWEMERLKSQQAAHELRASPFSPPATSTTEGGRSG